MGQGADPRPSAEAGTSADLQPRESAGFRGLVRAARQGGRSGAWRSKRLLGESAGLGQLARRSFRVDQGSSSLSKAKALGPEVFGVASCGEMGGKEVLQLHSPSTSHISMALTPIGNGTPAAHFQGNDGSHVVSYQSTKLQERCLIWPHSTPKGQVALSPVPPLAANPKLIYPSAH